MELSGDGIAPHQGNERREDQKMGRVERTREIARRRSRRTKLRKLRVKYAKATSADEKQALVAKARKLSPFISLDDSSE